jgi:hypothetical protein
MKKSVLYLLLIVLIMGAKIATSNQGEEIVHPGHNDVNIKIRPNAVIMPLERILLIRKGSEYCTIKFIKFWTGKTIYDQHATYELYYQDDKTGDFSNKNVKFRKEELYFPKASFSLFGHPFFIGAKNKIQCGSFKLSWSYKGGVYFYDRSVPEGDYGVELAPTKWTDISQVNVFDPRVKWYKFDSARRDKRTPVNHLWEDK